MKTSAFLFCAAMLCISGCATFGGGQHARELADNRQDDEYCQGRGLRYPGPGYVQCRRRLVDQRSYHDWKNLQLMQQIGAPSVNPAPVAPQAFRSPDPASFHCHAEPQFGNDYVFCGYDDTSAQPH